MQNEKSVKKTSDFAGTVEKQQNPMFISRGKIEVDIDSGRQAR